MGTSLSSFVEILLAPNFLRDSFFLERTGDACLITRSVTARGFGIDVFIHKIAEGSEGWHLCFALYGVLREGTASLSVTQVLILCAPPSTSFRRAGGESKRIEEETLLCLFVLV